MNGTNGKNHLARESKIMVQEQIELPPWMQAMRDALAGTITQEELTAVMKAQIEKAKEGNTRAAKFVFDQVRLNTAPEHTTLIQNNYHDGAKPPKKPTPALPGSEEKIEIMRRRLEAGVPLTHRMDGLVSRSES